MKKTKTNWIRADGFKPRWWKRPICWFKKHQKRTFNIYGARVKQCKRCGKYDWQKPTRDKRFDFYVGEVGALYGVRFVNSNRIKKIIDEEVKNYANSIDENIRNVLTEGTHK